MAAMENQPSTCLEDYLRDHCSRQVLNITVGQVRALVKDKNCGLLCEIYELVDYLLSPMLVKPCPLTKCDKETAAIRRRAGHRCRWRFCGKRHANSDTLMIIGVKNGLRDLVLSIASENCWQFNVDVCSYYEELKKQKFNIHLLVQKLVLALLYGDFALAHQILASSKNVQEKLISSYMENGVFSYLCYSVRNVSDKQDFSYIQQIIIHLMPEFEEEINANNHLSLDIQRAELVKSVLLNSLLKNHCSEKQFGSNWLFICEHLPPFTQLQYRHICRMAEDLDVGQPVMLLKYGGDVEIHPRHKCMTKNRCKVYHLVDRYFGTELNTTSQKVQILQKAIQQIVKIIDLYGSLGASVKCLDADLLVSDSEDDTDPRQDNPKQQLLADLQKVIDRYTQNARSLQELCRVVVRRSFRVAFTEDNLKTLDIPECVVTYLRLDYELKAIGMHGPMCWDL